MLGKLYTEKLVKVYVSRGGRKFFSKAAARRRGAWDLIKQHCTCHWPMSEADVGIGVEMKKCRYHQPFEYGENGVMLYHLGARLHARIVERAKREEERERKADKLIGRAKGKR